MKRFLATLFISFSITAITSAQKHLPANMFMKTMDNGLQVLVIEDNTVPLATIEIAVHNGSFTEDSIYNGLSHLYEHMFFKANKDIPSQELYLHRLSELGITLGPSANGTTNTERVNYFITLNSSKLDEGLHFMNSAIRYPLFLTEEMKKEDQEAGIPYHLLNGFGNLRITIARHRALGCAW